MRDNGKKEIMIIDITIPEDVHVRDKKLEKIEKYRLLNDGFARIGMMMRVSVIPVVVGALRGALTIKFEKYVEETGIGISAEQAQKQTAPWGTARILRLAIGC